MPRIDPSSSLLIRPSLYPTDAGVGKARYIAYYTIVVRYRHGQELARRRAQSYGPERNRTIGKVSGVPGASTKNEPSVSVPTGREAGREAVASGAPSPNRWPEGIAAQPRSSSSSAQALHIRRCCRRSRADTDEPSHAERPAGDAARASRLDALDLCRRGRARCVARLQPAPARTRQPRARRPRRRARDGRTWHRSPNGRPRWHGATS